MTDKSGDSEPRHMSKAEKDREEAGFAMDQTRFEFASKVARNEELTKEDLFAYIKSYAEFSKAKGIFRGRPVDDEEKLIKDCEDMVFSEDVKRAFEYRLWWAGDAVNGIERTKLLIQTEEFLGTKDTESIAGSIVNKAREDFLNDQQWLPYELAGLEKLQHFFEKD